MKRSLLAYIWTFSKRDQLVLVAVTAALFPLLYLTLELPKRIVNDAISGSGDPVAYFGFVLEQKTLLVVLCLIFLASVIVHGLLKMRVNTMKGVLAERLLRRFRYTLIEHILRFPREYQSKTSEGELVSMVTAETEPMGGIMGDAIAQPLLQAGQMLTILLFLFLQSVWFGLAACAMIPLQAWIIPYLQKQVNLLNRSRITQVRALASDIGEITTGAAILRQNNGWRFRMARTSARLGRLFETRFDIYKRKFFMKFLNNLLNQFPPFFFFLIGGLLVIEGHLTVGALVAAIAAYKDLSSPWKELLTYYTRVVEMGQRYELVVDRFTPTGLLQNFLPEINETPAKPDGAPKALALRQVTLVDGDGHYVLNGVDLEIAPHSWTSIAVEHDNDRAAFVQMLLRELPPSAGSITIGGNDLARQSQQSLSGCIGYITSRPYIFQGTVGENILMPLLVSPVGQLTSTDRHEAERTGNSTDAAEGMWQPSTGDAEVLRRARADWMPLVEELGAQKVMLSRVLDRKLDEFRQVELAEPLTQLRSDVRTVMAPTGQVLPRFAPDAYSDGLTIPENLLYAVKSGSGWLDGAESNALDQMLQNLSLHAAVLQQSVVLGAMLVEAFDADATESPLFRQLGVPAKILPKLHALAKRGGGRLTKDCIRGKADTALVMSLALNVPSARFDRAFQPELKQAVTQARGQVTAAMRAQLSDTFEALSPDKWNANLSIFDNLLFGKADEMPRARIVDVKEAVAAVVAEKLPALAIADLINDLPTDLRGANLSPHMTEVISLSQTAVKRPEIIILDDALASYDPESRQAVFTNLRMQLPDATILQIGREHFEGGTFDQRLSLRKGKILAEGAERADEMDRAETSELRRKLQAIRKAPLFSQLSGQQLRMLAFSARWSEVTAGTYIFRQNDTPDGAYLIYRGSVSLVARNPDGSENFVVTPPEGTLVGELGLIRNDPRRLDMRADSDTTLLQIDAEDFLSILETDAKTAAKLIRVLIGYLDRPS